MDLSLLSIEERLSKYKLCLDVGMQDAVVKPIIADHGYTDNVMATGKALYDKAYELNQKQEQEYGEQYGATDEFNKVRADAYTTYIKYVELARIILKNDRNLQNQLDLLGVRESNYDKLYMQMMQFYDTALSSEDVLQKLLRFNITKEKMTAGRTLVEVMQQHHQSQKKESSEAQRATRDRDGAMELLDDWMSDYRGLVKIVLTDEPEVLERMGIIDPS
jgi:hypothetical protein